jgi:hypothetical protein
MIPTTEKFAIYTNKIDSLIVEPVKDFIINKYNANNDFNIFSDVISVSAEPSYAILSAYYLPFYNGILVFTSLEDYISKQNEIVEDIVAYVIIDPQTTNNDTKQQTKFISVVDNKVVEL